MLARSQVVGRSVDGCCRFIVRANRADDGEADEVLYVDTNIGFAYGYEYSGLPREGHDPTSLVCCCAVETGLGEHLLQMPVRQLPPVAEGREFKVAAEGFVTDAVAFLEEHEMFIIRYVHDGIPGEA